MNYVWQGVSFQEEQAMKSYAKWGIGFYFFFAAMILPAIPQEILHHSLPPTNGKSEGGALNSSGGVEVEFRSKESLFHRPIALRLANIEEKDVGRNFDESATGNNLKAAVPGESRLNDAKVSDETMASGTINAHAKFSENGLTIEPSPVKEARQSATLREEVFLYTREVSGILGGSEKARSDGPSRIFK